MTEFLRAEWKTLLIAIVGFGTLYAVFFSEQDIRSTTTSAVPTVFPGEKVAGVVLGSPTDDVMRAFGEPSERRPELLGQEAWSYPDHGLTVFVHEGAVHAVRVERPADGQSRAGAWVLPNGDDLSSGLRKTSKALGFPGPVLELEGETWLRYAGLIIVVDRPSDDVPKALIVVREVL